MKALNQQKNAGDRKSTKVYTYVHTRNDNGTLTQDKIKEKKTKQNSMNNTLPITIRLQNQCEI